MPAQAGLIFIVTGGSLLRANIVAVSDEFDAAVQPLRANLLALLDTARDLREHHGALPMAASPAMAELAAEPNYVGGWGRQPVESAHSWAGLLIAAAENQLQTMCRIVVGEPSLYGPQSLARSALEMSGRSYWLTEGGIGVGRRVARFQTERLYNASEMRRLKGDAVGAARIEKSITETAEAQGFSLLRGKRHKHTHIVEERPSGNQVFKTLLQDVERQGLGHTMYSYLSAVDHGTIFGLLQAVGHDNPTEELRPTMRPLRMSASHTNQLVGVTTFGFGYALARYTELFGWNTDDWEKVFANTVRQVFELLRSRQN